MEAKHFNEEKDLPPAPFLMVVAIANGEEKPFYVVNVGRGALTEATMMTGYFLGKTIQDPPNITGMKAGSFSTDRLYIQNEKEKGKDRSVNYYRTMTPKENKVWKAIVPLLEKEKC